MALKRTILFLLTLLILAVATGCESNIALFSGGTGSSGSGGNPPPGTGGGTISYEPSDCTPTFASIFPSPASTSPSGPVIFFSDLDWGPKTGWENSATKGAAVTIWGRNFGSTRGSSFVTVNGAQATEYPEWGVVGPARGLERITFFLNSSCTDGPGTISVTVNGIESNTIPFRVMAGKIYFVSSSTGNNGYNGLYATFQSGTNGPFADISKFDPSAKPSDAGDSYIFYLRNGTYTSDVYMRGPYGSAASRHALAGYPGETPVFNGGIIENADYSPYGRNSYFIYSKLTGSGGVAAMDLFGDYNRVVGCTFKEYLDDMWTGVIFVSASKFASIYGNLFDHNGYDSYKHNVYIKTQTGANVDRTTEYIDVGWNEFSNPFSLDKYGGAIFISRSSDVGDQQTRCISIHDSYFHDGDQDFIYIGDNVDLGDIFIYNNLFNGGLSENGAISFAGGTNKVYLHNNVFYQTGTVAGVMIASFNTGGPLTSRIYSINNIWYNSPGVDFLYWDTGGKDPAFYSDHDLYFNFGTRGLPAGVGVAVYNAIIGDPQFVTPGTDFHLLATSPAIDAGSDLVQAIVTTDHDGNPRPAGSAYDIGIFAY
jgi:hypothetical protein